MFGIVFTVCSLLQGNGCRSQELRFADEGQSMMPYACMMQAQSEIAKWAEAHPNFIVKQWACGPVGRTANL
jgi:hypothetical protein